LGQLFQTRESLVSDILAGDGKLLNLYLQCSTATPCSRLLQGVDCQI